METGSDPDGDGIDAECECDDLPSGLVSWWTGDGYTDDIEDGNDAIYWWCSYLKNGATYENGATYATGKVGEAFFFDGIDDHMSAPGKGIDGLQEFTIDAWVYLNSMPENQVQRLVTCGKKFMLQCSHDSDSPNQLEFFVKIDDVLQHIFVPDTLEIGVWYLVAGTYDGSYMRLYVDGEEVGNFSVSGTAVAPGNGVGFSSPSDPLDGLLDEIEIYNRALSEEEIYSIYYAGAYGKCKPDADFDGIPDAVDNCPDGYNPEQEDEDEDRTGDVCDNCRDVYNWGQNDADGDCDALKQDPSYWDDTKWLQDPHCGDACDPDDDNDGILDDGSYGDGDKCVGGDTYRCDDNCQFVFNPNQTDSEYPAGDGIGDVCDNCPYFNNPDQVDADGDCDALKENSSYWDGKWLQDPHCGDVCDPDDDYDGVPDIDDNCTDSDGDDYGNPGYPANTCPADNCPLVPNPDQNDTDSDDMGDACDDDVDGDGILDDGDLNGIVGDKKCVGGDTTYCDDNCQFVSNLKQEDNDGDGMGDVCDPDDDNDCILDDGDSSRTVGDKKCVGGDTTYCDDNCQFVANFDQNDSEPEGDGVGDACDNCPDVYNPDQANHDLDGLGDVCDDDNDNDGVPDINDNCPMVYNPDQGDWCECSYDPHCDPTWRCIGWFQWNYGFKFGNPSGTELSYGDCWCTKGGCGCGYGNYKETFSNCEVCLCCWKWCDGKSPFAWDYYSFYENAAPEGQCTGMSISSLQFYYGDKSVSDYSSSASEVKDLYRGTDLRNHIKAMQGMTVSDAMIYHYLDSSYWGAENVLTKAKNDLANNKYGMIAILEDRGGGSVAGHTVVVDSIVETEDYGIKNAKIYVYDSNVESLTTKNLETDYFLDSTGNIQRIEREDYPHIDINENFNTYSFKMAGGSVWAGGGDDETFDRIGYLPYSKFDGDVDIPVGVYVLPGVATTFATLIGIISHLSEADAQIEDAEGRILGFKEDGTGISEIPNATILPIYGDGNSSEYPIPQLYVLAPGDYKMKVRGRTNGSYSGYMLGNLSIFVVHDVEVNENTKDTFSINPSLDTMSIETSDAEKTYSLEIVKKLDPEENSSERVFKVKNATIYAGSKAVFRIDPDSNFLTYTNRGDKEVTYSIEFQTTEIPEEDMEDVFNNQQLPTVYYDDIVIQPMETCILTAENWSDLNRSEINLSVETCGDGLCRFGEDIDNCPEDCDVDSDGIPNDEDNCPDIANPDQDDSDDDGIGDACDLNEQCNDRIDNDGDGLTDYPDDPSCKDLFDNSELTADVNDDCTVNIFDLAAVGLCYGQSASGNCQKADLTGDGLINIFDLATVGLNYGRSC